MPLDWPQLTLTFRGAWRMLMEHNWTAGARWNRNVHEHVLWAVWHGEGWLIADRKEQHRLLPGACFWTRPGRSYFAEQRGPERLGLAFVHFDLRDAAGRMLRHGDALPPLNLRNPDPGFLNETVHKLVEFDELAAWSALPAKVLFRKGPGGRANTRSAGRAPRPAGVELPETARSRLALARQVPPEHWRRMAEDQLRVLLMDLDARARLPAPRRRYLPVHEKAFRVRDLAQRMQANPSGLASLAVAVADSGLSKARLNELFREEVGFSPMGYFQFARVRQAMHRLRTSTMKMNHIARTVGFNRTNAFSDQFRIYAGCLPRTFRYRADQAGNRLRRAAQEEAARKKAAPASPSVRARIKKPRKKKAAKAHAKPQRRKGKKGRGKR